MHELKDHTIMARFRTRGISGETVGNKAIRQTNPCGDHGLDSLFFVDICTINHQSLLNFDSKIKYTCKHDRRYCFAY